MKVAIVGCGKISLSHISALQELADIEICAVCDRDEQRAREAAQAANGARIYNDLGLLIERERPTAVHILTPPATHAALAIQAMEAGCHVIVEKPMCLSVAEADSMIAAAKANRVKLATCHNYLFKPSISKARELVKSGAIGQTVFVNTYYGLSGEGNSYAGAAGQSHWAWRLPGGVFTNFLPHTIYLQREFIPDMEGVADVTMWQAPGAALPTEVLTTLRGTSASGTMTVSMRARPYAKFVEIYGTKGIIRADMVSEVCIINRERHFPRLISKVTFNLEKSLQLAYGTAASTLQVARGKMKNMPDLRVLVRKFYESVKYDLPAPVTGEDGRKMVEIMEQMWARMQAQQPQAAVPTVAASAPEAPKSAAERTFQAQSKAGKVLVTGAAGFLGSRLIEALRRAGVSDIVALVRDKSRVPMALERQATIAAGDVSDPAAVEAAMQGVDIVFHCAAITRNNVPWKVHQDTNIRGTEVVLEAARKVGVKRVVHVSSVIVYGLEKPGNNGNCVNEAYPFATQIDEWSHYMRSKIEAEKLAFSYWREHQVPVTIIRPGILYGPGSGRAVGRGLGQLGPLWLMIGDGKNSLPFTYVDNAVDALLLAGIAPEAPGQAYNIVDDPQVYVRDTVALSAEISGERLVMVPVPTPLLSGVAGLLEKRAAGAAKPPKLSRFVVQSAARNIRYDTNKARQQLGWQPEIALDEGLRRTLDQTL